MLSLSAALTALAPAAIAEQPPPVESPRPSDLGEEPLEEITVTGSTIRRKDLVTPAPVILLDKADLDAAGAPSIGEVLQNLVSQGNAINTQVNNRGDGSTRVNLRSVGAERTLVLVSGRHHVYGGIGARPQRDSLRGHRTASSPRSTTTTITRPGRCSTSAA